MDSPCVGCDTDPEDDAGHRLEALTDHELKDIAGRDVFLAFMTDVSKSFLLRLLSTSEGVDPAAPGKRCDGGKWAYVLRRSSSSRAMEESQAWSGSELPLRSA